MWWKNFFNMVLEQFEFNSYPFEGIVICEIIAILFKKNSLFNFLYGDTSSNLTTLDKFQIY